SEANTISRRPAMPALAAKAPGQPEYGVHITSPQGQFIFTNLEFAPGKPKGGAVVYRVVGPAGLGPFRLGLQLGLPSDWRKANVNPGFYQGTFLVIQKALEGGAAKGAGLDEDWAILGVDGQNFGWNMNSLISYLTTRPAVEILALKVKGWGVGTKQKTFRIELRKVDAPVDPADGALIPEQPEGLQTYLGDPNLWSELAALRSALPRFRPLPMELGARRMWAVRGASKPPSAEGGQADPITLEFWREDPASGPKQHYPAALWVEPEDGLRTGRVLQVDEHWYRIQDVALEEASGRLLKLALQPWMPDVQGLLVGADLARDLGPRVASAPREAYEQQANEALIEWKIRTLPGLLTTQGLGATEDLVVLLEKGLLKLDLEVKGIRSRLDAAALTEAERKAAAELAAKHGKPAPVAGPPATESERLADLLEQRKAILMAVLGSAKQSLSTLRR
ncbi:MAG TPA: hypothetical protein VF378_10700, partial [Geothrix sp.]